MPRTPWRCWQRWGLPLVRVLPFPSALPPSSLETENREGSQQNIKQSLLLWTMSTERKSRLRLYDLKTVTRLQDLCERDHHRHRLDTVLSTYRDDVARLHDRPQSGAIIIRLILETRKLTPRGVTSFAPARPDRLEGQQTTMWLHQTVNKGAGISTVRKTVPLIECQQTYRERSLHVGLGGAVLSGGHEMIKPGDSLVLRNVARHQFLGTHLTPVLFTSKLLFFQES